ncbi:MAG: hypothetical protein GF398_07840 [Chitinivibrionales bacterium]|nr:hypothetical protein [Chitinivibrionales bacterium]
MLCSSMISAKRALVVQFLIFCFLIAAVPAQSVRVVLGENSWIVKTCSTSAGRALCLNALVDSLGFTLEYDEQLEKLDAVRGRLELTWQAQNHFIQVGSETWQLPAAPVENGGELYVKEDVLCDVMTTFCGDTIAVDTVGPTAGNPPVSAPEASLKTKGKGLGVPSGVAAPIPSQATGIKGQKLKTIVIDAGHGGKDPGAIGSKGTLEKDIVLAIALKLRDRLTDNTDLDVHLTRDKDVFIALRKRTQFANEKNADLFISLHCNSIGGNGKRKRQVKGYKVYFLSHAKNEADKLAAMRENSVIELEKETTTGDDLQDILIALANNEYLTESQDMSIMLAESFGRKLQSVGKLHAGVGQANFWVLNGAYMPSVLVETAFISNPTEEKILKTDTFQTAVADAVFEAIMLFKKKYEVEL